MNQADKKLFASLVGAEVDYARDYADHLAVGEPKPAEAAGVDPKLCHDIRAALHREWSGRLKSSPALSGRLKIERGTRRE